MTASLAGANALPSDIGAGQRIKSLIVFDLDGTLAESKSAIDEEMGTLLAALLQVAPVAVISGGDLPQFKEQILTHLPHDANLARLSLLPTCGTRLFQYTDTWNKLYSEDLSGAQKRKIIGALTKEVAASGFAAKDT